MRTFIVTMASFELHTLEIKAYNAGQARYAVFRKLKDAGYEPKFGWIKVRLKR